MMKGGLGGGTEATHTYIHRKAAEDRVRAQKTEGWP